MNTITNSISCNGGLGRRKRTTSTSSRSLTARMTMMTWLLVSTMEFVVAQNDEILQRIDSVELLSEEEAKLYESSSLSSSSTGSRYLPEATATMETQTQQLQNRRGMNTQNSRIRYAQPRNSRDPNIDRSYLLRGADAPARQTANNNEEEERPRAEEERLTGMFEDEGDTLMKMEEPPMISRQEEVPKVQTEERKPCEYLKTTHIVWHLGIFDTLVEAATTEDIPLGKSQVWNRNLLHENIHEVLPDSYVSGLCTRTQLADNPAEQVGGSVPGVGRCRLTYTFPDDEELTQATSFTVNAEGEIADGRGGVLAVAGGTGSMVGVTGEVMLLPYQVDLEAGDVTPAAEQDPWTDVDLFLVKVTLYQDSCLRRQLLQSSSTRTNS